jgi:hypothetical protein
VAKVTLLISSALFLVQGSLGGVPVPPDIPVEIRGKLHFKSRKADFEGTNLGQDGDDRLYIFGHPSSPQRAIWTFDKLPKSYMTTKGDAVQVKLKCSHFAMTKQDGQGALVVIRAVSHTCPQVPPNLQQQDEWKWVNGDQKEQFHADMLDYRARKIDPRERQPGAEDWKAANTLAEKFGFWEVEVPKVPELKYVGVNLPSGLFRNALKNPQKVGADGKPERPLVSIYVKCVTKGLLIGVMESDMYLVAK